MDLVFETGRCCEGDKYHYPEGELRPRQKFPKYERIMHQQCSIFDATLDKNICNTCANIELSHNKSGQSCTTEDVNIVTSNNEGNTKIIMDTTVKVKSIEEYNTITDNIK